ncbi:hypothetical protein BDV33DRAFT_205106 [Aspergillus novoparasiticus]|uniref:Uncharacterized protein n=1 Tax=Aspergillus novoparasiticus TaxID=986946 RepID=A0A5N6EPM2_9EURO|nr:hypothetical protein BDV33DRAFT_205106 [Aspergillus novoparasiticus]
MRIPESRPGIRREVDRRREVATAKLSVIRGSPNSPQAHVLFSLDCLSRKFILGSSGALLKKYLQDEGALGLLDAPHSPKQRIHTLPKPLDPTIQKYIRPKHQKPMPYPLRPPHLLILIMNTPAKADPLITPAKTSIMRANPLPFGPLIGKTTPPSNAATGSVVGRPCASSAYPSGIDSTRLAAPWEAVDSVGVDAAEVG